MGVTRDGHSIARDGLHRRAVGFGRGLFVLMRRFGGRRTRLRVTSSTSGVTRGHCDAGIRAFVINGVSALSLGSSRAGGSRTHRGRVGRLFCC